MSSIADSIREAGKRYIEAAKSAQYERVTIVAGDLVRELRLHNRVPNVCSALASKRFQEENHIVLESREGPPSGQSTTSKFTYRVINDEAHASTAMESFRSLRGAGKATYAKYGGGEAFLRGERDAFGDQ